VGHKTEEAVIAAHPRYQELRTKFGQTEAYVPPRQDNLNSRIITLNIHRILTSLAKGSPTPGHSTSPTIVKALPSMKLQTLQQKLRKTFKVPPKAEMNLYLEMLDTVTELESGNSHDLIWWGLGDGSNLFIYVP